MQCENCEYELSFLAGRMRPAAWETAPQTALRNCSRGSGEVIMYVVLLKGEYMQSSTYFLQKVYANHKELSSP